MLQMEASSLVFHQQGAPTACVHPPPSLPGPFEMVATWHHEEMANLRPAQPIPTSIDNFTHRIECIDARSSSAVSCLVKDRPCVNQILDRVCKMNLTAFDAL